MTYIYLGFIAIISTLLLFHSIQIYPVFPKKTLSLLGIIVFLALVATGYWVFVYEIFSNPPLFINIILFGIYTINIYSLIRSIININNFKKLEAENE